MIETLFGAVWRFVDGTHYRPAYWNVVLITFLLFHDFGFNNLTTESALAYLWCLVITTVNILIGFKHGFFKGWTHWSMVFRYSLYAFISVLPMYLLELTTLLTYTIYVVSCALAGWSYPLFHKLSKVRKLPTIYSIGIDGYDSYSRMLVGASVIGGLSIVII